MKTNKKINLILMVLLGVALIPSCSQTNKYKVEKLWAVSEKDKEATVDTFFVNPTSAFGSSEKLVIDLTNEKELEVFKGAILMEKGIYDDHTRFFAPYYNQALLSAYILEESETEKYLSAAYKDVKESFDYYLKNINKGNKIILAGFSQGADMCLRLLKDYVNNNTFYQRFIACYALGWKVSDEYLNQNPRLKAATSATDQKVIISFNSEAVDVNSSYFVKAGEYSHAINPLTWTTSSEVADKSLNLGAVFLDTRGAVVREEANYKCCYIDPERGTLKVPDAEESLYPSVISFIEDGVYHLYEYQFFYRNLEENVYQRILNS